MVLEIGKYKIKNKKILAPILEYTNYSFRELCSKNNCALTYTEMTHLNNIINTPFSDLKKRYKKNNSLVTLQLVGDFRDYKTTEQAFLKAEKLKTIDIIDFNLGCPSQKIIAGSSGVLLLDSIEEVTETLKKLKETSKKPITAKIRLGYKKDNSVSILKNLEKTNIDALAIHGRLGVEDYSIPSDYNKVKALAKDTSLSIIYNGDINQNNLSFFEEIEEFSGVMIAREALKHPEIFTNSNKQNSFLKNLNLFLKISKSNKNSVINQKLVLLQLLSGFKGAKKNRQELTQLKTQEEIDGFIKNLLEQNKKSNNTDY